MAISRAVRILTEAAFGAEAKLHPQRLKPVSITDLYGTPEGRAPSKQAMPTLETLSLGGGCY
jgi:hypothetical protein